MARRRQKRVLVEIEDDELVKYVEPFMEAIKKSTESPVLGYLALKRIIDELSSKYNVDGRLYLARIQALAKQRGGADQGSHGRRSR